MKSRSLIELVCICCLTYVSCTKENNLHFESDEKANDVPEVNIISDATTLNPEKVLSYGDSVFYISEKTNNIIYPVQQMGSGKYLAFPGGLEIDSLTGAIDIAESETGLRYRVMFVPEHSNDTLSVKIVLSGINFYDQIFNLSKGDSMAYAIYNASGIPFVQGQFGVGKSCKFDDGNGCTKQGFAVSGTEGHLNLAQSLRNGALPLKNGSVKETVYYYRMDDRSEKALNKLKVKLYVYNTVNDIPAYLWDIILKERTGTIIPALHASSGLRARTASPRPPCLIIVMN